MDADCAGLIAGKPAPTVILAVHRFCIYHIKPVGAGSPAMAVCQATSMLTVLATSRASRKRALAPTMNLVAHRFCIHPYQTCGSGLARDSGVSGNIDVDCNGLIASRLAPTMNLVGHGFCIHPHQTCGSGLARDGGVSGNIDVDCAGHIASKLAPTMNLATDFVYTTSNLWERACPRWRCVRRQRCWLCRPHREQARSYSEFGWSQILYTPTSNLWERACPRWRCVRRQRCWLCWPHREQAASGRSLPQ